MCVDCTNMFFLFQLGVNARMLKTDGTPESAEVITPTIVGDIGHTDGLDGNHWARHPNSHQSHLLVLKLDLKNSTIRLNLRQDIVALTVRTEWIGENHTSLNEINRKCMFEGTLDGATEQTATVSICNGIVSGCCFSHVLSGFISIALKKPR